MLDGVRGGGGKGNTRQEGGLRQTQERFLEPGKGSEVSGSGEAETPSPATDSYSTREDQPQGHQLLQRPSELQTQ